MIIGKSKEELTPSGVYLWVDVRDIALAHVRAATLPEAGGKRFFITAGHFSNRDIANLIYDAFPELGDRLPTKETKGGDYPEGGMHIYRSRCVIEVSKFTDAMTGVYKYDNSRVKEVLGIQFRSLKESVVDTVKSLQAVGA